METEDDPPKRQGTSPGAEAKELEGEDEDASATSEGENCDQSSGSSEDAQAIYGSDLEVIGETDEGAERGQAIAIAERGQADGEEIVQYEDAKRSPEQEEKDEPRQIAEVGQPKSGNSVATITYEDSANLKIGKCGQIEGYVVRPDFLEGQNRRSVMVGQSMDTVTDTIKISNIIVGGSY